MRVFTTLYMLHRCVDTWWRHADIDTPQQTVTHRNTPQHTATQSSDISIYSDTTHTRYWKPKKHHFNCTTDFCLILRMSQFSSYWIFWLFESCDPSNIRNIQLNFLVMGWLRLVGALKLQVSIGEYILYYRALLEKRPIILRSLLIVATPYLSPVIHQKELEYSAEFFLVIFDGSQDSFVRIPAPLIFGWFWVNFQVCFDRI